MVSALEQMQIPNGTGPGDRRSKLPLLASPTHCNVIWKTSQFGNKVKSIISSKIGVMSDQLRVSLYMVMSHNV